MLRRTAGILVCLMASAPWACSSNTPECSVGSDCASGVCESNGKCAPVSGTRRTRAPRSFRTAPSWDPTARSCPARAARAEVTGRNPGRTAPVRATRPAPRRHGLAPSRRRWWPLRPERRRDDHARRSSDAGGLARELRVRRKRDRRQRRFDDRQRDVRVGPDGAVLRRPHRARDDE